MINQTRLLLASAILALAFGPLRADPKPTLVVQNVTAADPDAYATVLAKANALIKARTGAERLRHLWVGDFAGPGSHTLVVTSLFDSAAASAALTEKFKNDAEMNAVLKEFKGIRTLGASYLYKAVRFEGLHDNGAVFVTDLTCSDEDAYAKALDGLKAIFDANGFKDAKLNLFRIAAGRGPAATADHSTHMVVISEPSQARLLEFIDAIQDKGLLKEWNVTAAKLRTSDGNSTWHEITK